MKSHPPWGLHWFRRDLRVAGNPALQWNWKQSAGRVLGIFCFDPVFLSRSDFSAPRFAFFLDTLSSLREELRTLGGDLLILDRGPTSAFSELLEALITARAPAPSIVTWNRDYEPFARTRDGTVEALLNERGIQTHSERDHLIVEPAELTKDREGSFYQVYSPFARKWISLLAKPEFRSRITGQKASLESFSTRGSRSGEKLFSLQWPEMFSGKNPLADSFADYRERNLAKVTIPIPAAGTAAAMERVTGFAQSSLDSYANRRDIPGVDGTSKLSIYFKNGSLSTAQALAMMELSEGDPKGRDGPSTYLREIIWREFYYHILYHRPDVEGAAFLHRYREIEWDNDEELFAAWKEGRTGFPIVDAGMRQLNQTGWMHNRVRMIVASFLTKDLHIDWKWGERYFMEKLLDGDLAPNNGGWQWAASTGCDPQPYFRIFNPLLQSQRFDPAGDYIREFVPELKSLKSSEIHDPSAGRCPTGYPPPVVEHDVQKHRALEMYKKMNGAPSNAEGTL